MKKFVASLNEAPDKS